MRTLKQYDDLKAVACRIISKSAAPLGSAELYAELQLIVQLQLYSFSLS